MERLELSERQLGQGWELLVLHFPWEHSWKYQLPAEVLQQPEQQTLLAVEQAVQSGAQAKLKQQFAILEGDYAQEKSHRESTQNELAELKAALLQDPRFVPVQKSRQNVVPLISLKYLLGLLALLLAAEWSTRKYNGLI